MKAIRLLTIFIFFAVNCNAQTDTSYKVLHFAEQMPKFPGGDAELMKFLQQNLRTLSEKSGNEVCGSMQVKFVIDTDGTAIEPKITKSCGSEWDVELIKLIKSLPKFKPGYQDGKAVKVYFNLPIHFRTDNHQNKN